MTSELPGNGLNCAADRWAVLFHSWRSAVWFLMAWLTLGPAVLAAGPEALQPSGTEAAITPVPRPPFADPSKLELGERLFDDRRLSHDNTLACSSCHDVHTNGADDSRRTRWPDGSTMPFTTLSVFNAALSFRLDWRGDIRTLQAQALASLEDQTHMASTIDEVLHKFRADRQAVQQFQAAYGRPPDQSSLLDAIATYERSLLTPGSRFDLWLTGDKTALSPAEQQGYGLFQSLGCISCHQGVNIGGNLYERRGIFHPLASGPTVLRVPSLRNVAVMAPYFSDGSVATLEEAVRRMAWAQLDQELDDQQVEKIVAFLKTLTGKFNGVTVRAPSP
jgi:cytochrome c peroxidase